MNRVALAGTLFAGKSTLGRELERRGYFYINFSRVLKQIAANMLEPFKPEIDVEEIEANKEHYRPFLIEVGNQIGFNWHPGFVNIALQPWWQAGMPDKVVFDPPRYDAQFEVLRPYGFNLVYLDFFTQLPQVHPEQLRRARKVGMGVRELRRRLADQSENGLTVEALHLDATWTTEELADLIERGVTVNFEKDEAANVRTMWESGEGAGIEQRAAV